MATKQFVGRASKTTQVVKVAFSSILATHTYSVAINGKTISYTSAGTSLTTVVDALVAAWNSSAEPEHQEMVAAQHITSSTVDGLMLTAKTAGVPCTVTASATTGSATPSDDVAASGPNFWNVAANWSGGTLPSAGDTLELIDSDVSILYGLTDTANYAALKIYASYTGQVGLPAKNANGYSEYRTRRLTLGDGSGTIAVTVGEGAGTCSPAIRLNMADNVTTLQVLDGPQNQNDYPLEVFDMKSTSTVASYGGQLLIDDSTTGTVASIKVAARSDSRTKPRVKTTSRITATAVEAYGSGTYVELNGAGTTLKARDQAQVKVGSAAAIGTVTVGSKAVVSWDSSGGIGTQLTVEPEGTMDFSRSTAAKTIAATALHRAGTLLDPFKVCTFTGGVVLQGGAKIADVKVDLGPGVTLSV